MNYMDHITNPNPSTTYIQRDELCGIHINIYLPSSPGALAKKTMPIWKKLESGNFQESYLGAHLMSLYKVRPNPRGGKFSIQDGRQCH